MIPASARSAVQSRQPPRATRRAWRRRSFTRSARACAPQCLTQRQKPKGDVLGETEKSKTDKLRERRSKKQAKRFAAREKDKAQKLIAKLKVAVTLAGAHLHHRARSREWATSTASRTR